MEPFIKADIFFFVTTIAIILLTFLLSIILVYGIYFVRNMYLVSKNVKQEVDAIIGLVSTVREVVEDKGLSVLDAITRFYRMFQGPKKASKKASKKTQIIDNN